MPLTKDDAIRMAELGTPFLVEFLGSFFVALTYGLNILTGSLVWLSTSVAFAIMVCMIGTGNVSGGQLNPAVSFAFGLARKTGWPRVVGYWIAQLTGALFAGVLVTRLIVGEKIPVAPQGQFDLFDVGVVEVVFTSLMCFVALSCMASLRNNPKRRRNQFSSVAVGFVYIAGGQAAYQISGAFFNPALAVAYACTGPAEDWKYLHYFVGFQALGATIAAMLFFMLRPEELIALRIGSLDDEGLDWQRSIAVICPSCFGRYNNRETAAAAAEPRLPPPGGGGEEDEALATYLERYKSPLGVRLLAEFLGVFFVVTTYGITSFGNKLAVKAMEAGLTREGQEASEAHNQHMKVRLAVDAKSMDAAEHWALGAAIVSLSYALGDVSGAHFNPAVTLAAALSQPGMWEMAESLLIMVAQCGGGVAAAMVYLLLARSHGSHDFTTNVLGPGEGHRMRAIVLGETVFTCAVALVVLSVTAVKSPRYARAANVRSFPFALAIGFCVAGGGLTIDSHTCGILNPALTVGVSFANVVGNNFDLSKYLPMGLYYVLWQMVGGFVASVLFVMTHPLEYKKDPLMV